MKKTLAGLIAILFFVGASVAFAGGDKNQHRYDGSKGKGEVKQHRVNK